VVEYGENDVSEHTVTDPALTTDHAVTIKGLKPNTTYSYRVQSSRGGSPWVSEVFSLETNCNYSLPDIPDRTSQDTGVQGTEAIEDAAAWILEDSGISRGYCLVLGSGNGRFAYELARRSRLRVVGVEADPDTVAEARSLLTREGIYGPRATVREVESLSRLPFPGHFANLVVAEPLSESDPIFEEIMRVLRPNGGSVYLGLAEAGGDPYAWRVVQKPPLPGARDWSHQYAGAHNSACSNDDLQGATGTGEMEVQWFGRPGGDAVMDRNPRKPAPLSTNGRLFLQGFNRIVTMDAYNGAILWSLEIPELRRVNMPRDCSNWCADNDYVYVAIKDACWRLDAATGELVQTYTLSADPAQDGYDWGFLASAGSQILGTQTRKGAAYTEYWGKKYWYDLMIGSGNDKVCSDLIFAMDKNSGAREWSYSDGMIINSTITVGGEYVYFVTCRNPQVEASGEGRVNNALLWKDLVLVALDRQGGQVAWEKPIQPWAGSVVFYLGYTDDPGPTLVLASSGFFLYALYAYDARTGDDLWSAFHPWPGQDHGDHMQHAALVDGMACLYPRCYRIGDGQTLPFDMPPRSGCPTVAAGSRVFVYRGEGGNIALWDSRDNLASFWDRLRPGCWLSAIPAGGMILAPEGGAGCSCGKWLQTSVCFTGREQNR